MLENTHPLMIIARAVLTTLLINSHAFQAAFTPVATGQWLWYIPFQSVCSVAVYVLFACSIAAALFKLLASHLGTGAAYFVLGAKWGAYGVGAVALVVVGALVAVAWCTAVHDISRKSVAWCKAVLDFAVREARELEDGEQTGTTKRVDSVFYTPEDNTVEKTVLPGGFIGGREYIAQTQATPVSVHCVGCGMSKCYEVGSGMCLQQGGTYWRWFA